MEDMKKGRITPSWIDSLKAYEILVFGSILAGMHGGGAARIARLLFGAVMGKGVGLQGQSYAIPTMAQLSISHSAVTQRCQKMMHDVVIPYFKRYFDASEYGSYLSSAEEDT